ncbi:DNA topoisomerase 1 [Nakaseomyces bracarensis]|uniref:DNA topoisomerase I n=1 Tax=Nakaseomyces bracarensis TaxID=273131 RepID=A0ABR4NQF4_9SACH
MTSDEYKRDESDEDVPLSQTIMGDGKNAPQAKKGRDKSKVAESVKVNGSANGSPNGSSKSKKVSKVPKRKRAVKTEDDDDESLSSKKLKKIKTEKGNVEPKKVKDEEEEEIDEKKSLSQVVSEIKREGSEETDEEYKWWEEQNKDDTIKWKTLKHNGVLFPPDYQPLPSHIKLYYGGKPVDLPVEAEEVAGFFANLLHTDHAKNPVFQKNAFEDFLKVLKEAGGTRNGIEIKDFNKCDYTKIHEYYELQKEQKKNMTREEKKQIKLEKEKFEEKFKYCELDGRKEQVGNFRVEPPDLFRGRGAHPKTGKLKRRVNPEDIILNLSKDAPIPPAPAGHHWGEIRHDNTVQWLAMWKENIFGSFKYVRLAANSSLNGLSDLKKFEKARDLKQYIDDIRKDYRKNFKNKVMLERQKAVAIYLIDVFALRAGGEKSEDEADTVGCCSLRFEHVTLKPPNTVIFDFLGKDSIRYHQEVEVDTQVFKNLKIFKRPPKKDGDDLFDRLDPSILNKYLQNYMPGLTAKVFRTYNASKTMQDQLDLIPNKGTVAEKLLAYNAANRTVAILCNHQRSVTKGHAQSVEKMNQKIEELVWQKIRLKKSILQLEPAMAKKKTKYFKEIHDMTKAEQATIHKRVIAREREKFEKKFARENEKRVFEKEDPLPKSELKAWLTKVDELEKQYKDELKTGKIELKSSMQSVDKLEKQIEKLEDRIKTTTIQLKDKEENSQVSLGTSKINYIDPRLSVVFCKKYNVPIEKIFTKTLREKFKWAIESVDENWRF